MLIKLGNKYKPIIVEAKTKIERSLCLMIEIIPPKKAVTLLTKRRATRAKNRTSSALLKVDSSRSFIPISMEKDRAKYNKIKIAAPTDHFPKRVAGLKVIFAGAEGLEPPALLLERSRLPLTNAPKFIDDQFLASAQ